MKHGSCCFCQICKLTHDECECYLEKCETCGSVDDCDCDEVELVQEDNVCSACGGNELQCGCDDTCMCGDSMEDHGIYSGHSAVSMKDYYGQKVKDTKVFDDIDYIVEGEMPKWVRTMKQREIAIHLAHGEWDVLPSELKASADNLAKKGFLAKSKGKHGIVFRRMDVADSMEKQTKTHLNYGQFGDRIR